MPTPKVIDTIVKNDLCIGCGLCVYKCPNKAIGMKWNKFGFLTPELTGNCDSDENCISVCPFNPTPDETVKTENELARIFLQDTQKHHPKIGKYTNIYAGYANEFRLSSSSGGMATYIITELLKKGIVDYIFSVKESEKPGTYYEYAISSTSEQVLNTAKTRYYPVTLQTVMPKIHELDGKVAIAGVACFIKAIRLAQYKEPVLKQKIPFLVGIICGGVKSRFFTEYLAQKAGVTTKNIEKPQFRVKDLNSTANDYSFSCFNKEEQKNQSIKMQAVGDMWGSGLFKNNACDYCDDVTTELADISLGDAWFKPYSNDGAGTNVIVSRTALADEIIQSGIEERKLTIEPLSRKQFLASQRGSYNHRHNGLSFRILQAKKNNHPTPPKRFDNEHVTFDFKRVQKLRMKIRQRSLEVWAEKPEAQTFDNTMKKQLRKLKTATKISRHRRSLKRKLFRKQ